MFVDFEKFAAVGRLDGWTHFGRLRISKFRFNILSFLNGGVRGNANDGQVPHDTCPSDAYYNLTLSF